jgi:hypothetical protein
MKHEAPAFGRLFSLLPAYHHCRYDFRGKEIPIALCSGGNPCSRVEGFVTPTSTKTNAALYVGELHMQ